MHDPGCSWERDSSATAASGTAAGDCGDRAARRVALTTCRLTVAADKAYEVRAWVAAVRRMGITPHVAQNEFGREYNDDRPKKGLVGLTAAAYAGN